MIREMIYTDIPAARALLSQLGYEMDSAEVERRFNAVKQKEDHGVFVVEEEGRVIALLHVYGHVLPLTNPRKLSFKP
jgi:hypothetical protein